MTLTNIRMARGMQFPNIIIIVIITRLSKKELTEETEIKLQYSVQNNSE